MVLSAGACLHLQRAIHPWRALVLYREIVQYSIESAAILFENDYEERI